MKLAVGSDHAGFEQKQELLDYLKDKGYEVKDFGTYSTESVDYPDYVHPLAEAISDGEYDFGILLCGSANGVAMAANKHRGVRAAVCWSEEITELSRQHNDANVLCLPSRFITMDDAQKFTDVFLTTSFEGGRHERRVNKIAFEPKGV